MNSFCFLATPSLALCLLKGQDGLFYPTATSENPSRESWVNLIKKNTGMDIGKVPIRIIGSKTYLIRYSVNLGAFNLGNGYIDDEWLDIEEISLLPHPQLSPFLKEALEELRLTFDT